MTAPLTRDEAERRIAAALAEFDACANDCPARKRRLGSAECPKCRSGPSDGCGLEIGGAYAFIAKVRATLAKQEQTND